MGDAGNETSEWTHRCVCVCVRAHIYINMFNHTLTCSQKGTNGSRGTVASVPPTDVGRWAEHPRKPRVGSGSGAAEPQAQSPREVAQPGRRTARDAPGQVTPARPRERTSSGTSAPSGWGAVALFQAVG